MENYIAATADQAQPCIAPHEECLGEVINEILCMTYNNIGTVNILLHELSGENPTPLPDTHPENIKMHIEITRKANEVLTDRLNDLKHVLIG